MSTPPPPILPLGERGWTVVLGDTVERAVHERVTRLARSIGETGIPGVIEIVPAYATVTVFFEGDAETVRRGLSRLCQVDRPGPPDGPVLGATDPGGSLEPRLHVIPVVYDGADLEEVSVRTGLSRAEVIDRHSNREYRVYLLGFAPGFGYLGELDPALILPRRPSPRTRVPAGSVAIAAEQTAVYPLATPGGWHLLGTTPLRMFDPARASPALLRVGDRVRFESA